MSSVQSEISGIPKSKLLLPEENTDKPLLQAKNSMYQKAFREKTFLIVKGQGVLTGKLENNKMAFSFSIFGDDDQNGFKLTISAADSKTPAQFFVRRNSMWEPVFTDVNSKTEDEFDVTVKSGAGLDPETNCHYWFSVDSHNRLIRYGKGEVRKNTMLAELHYRLPEHKKPDLFTWMSKVKSIHYTHDEQKPSEKNYFIPVKLFRDPVTSDAAMYVLPVDAITMEDMARNRATVAANLTPTCQQLYSNVAGARFDLNTPDFPDFANAIEASIASPLGWCNQELKRKSTEFGGEPNPDMTYLRITMGLNQGDSPGVPFVMEIWPPGHYSPVHNHAGANAVIRVLHGEITVNMYSMLSHYHLNPFMVAKFGKGDVTWISPQLNQTHQLRNTNVTGPTCITIQCYMYGEGNKEHYSYFDYLNSQGQVEQFNPNSDCDFLAFKEKMREEWIRLFKTA